jgi:rod shape determining protein RodA
MIRKVLSRLDIGIIGAALILIAAGLLVFASSNQELFYRQLIWLTGALVLMIGLPFINLRAIFSYKWVIFGIYSLILVLLLVTYLAAPTIHGARSWIVLGPFQLQASEFMKAAFIILMSSFFATRHIAIARLGIIIRSFVYLLVPTIIILLQPDLGTALVLFGIWLGYLLISELPVKFIVAGLLIAMLVGALSWSFLLAGYQKARISALFHPGSDQLGVNYSVAQSKIALGSAGFFGKGFGGGTQVQLGFLPAAQTDFVFASFVEEWGIIGGIFLISVFVFLVYRVLSLGIKSEGNFSRLMALGTATMLIIHFIINMGSTLGLLPVIGIGFPFVSYGGSNLLTISALIGIIQGVAEKRVGA